MASGILSRKRDLVYLLYFCTAIPIAFNSFISHSLYPLHHTRLVRDKLSFSYIIRPSRSTLQLTPTTIFPLIPPIILTIPTIDARFSVTVVDLQPIYLIPKWMTNLTDFYIATYHDQFFTDPTPFFELFLWSEALIQVPVMVWGVGALLRGSPKLPLVLLPFSCLIFATTATCMFEYWHWAVPMAHKINLTTLYGPYLFLSAFMLGDMFMRLNCMINSLNLQESEAKRR